MRKLEAVLPKELEKKATFLIWRRTCSAFCRSLSSIVIATEHQVAVLGVDAFEVQSDGLATVALFDPSR